MLQGSNHLKRSAGIRRPTHTAPSNNERRCTDWSTEPACSVLCTSKLNFYCISVIESMQTGARFLRPLRQHSKWNLSKRKETKSAKQVVTGNEVIPEEKIYAFGLYFVSQHTASAHASGMNEGTTAQIPGFHGAWLLWSKFTLTCGPKRVPPQEPSGVPCLCKSSSKLKFCCVIENIYSCPCIKKENCHGKSGITQCRWKVNSFLSVMCSWRKGFQEHFLWKNASELELLESQANKSHQVFRWSLDIRRTRQGGTTGKQNCFLQWTSYTREQTEFIGCASGPTMDLEFSTSGLIILSDDTLCFGVVSRLW